MRTFSAANRGSSTLLFAALILPLLFFLFTLSADLATYFKKSEDAQRAADDAALYATRFMPYTDQARRVASSLLAARGYTANSVSIANDSVAIEVEADVPLSFASFFNLDAKIPLSRHSRARGAPLDTFIALDVSDYLALPLDSAEDGAWSPWGAAPYFSDNLGLFRYNGEIVPAAIATQRCFNPVLNQLKMSAIRLYDYLSGFSQNATAVAFFPGSDNDNWPDLVRDAVPHGAQDLYAGEAAFVPLTGSGSVSETDCALAAEGAGSAENFAFPLRPQNIAYPWKPATGAPLSLVIAGTRQFDPGYLPYLEARQLIWTRVAKEGRTPDFLRLLTTIKNSLLGQGAVMARGGLKNRGVKKAVILAGDVPWFTGLRFPDSDTADSLQTALNTLKDLIQNYNGAANDKAGHISLSIDYLALKHPGNDFGGRDARFSAMETLWAGLNESYREAGVDVQLRFFQGSSAELLTTEILSALASSNKSAVLME